MNNIIDVAVGGPVGADYPKVYKTKFLKPGISVALQITEQDTKYVVKHSFDLGGESITIPAGCVLEFDGGSVSNGTLVGDNTQIIAPESAIFTGITISGTWNCPYITSVWFSDAEENNVLKQLINLSSDGIWNDIYVKEGIYNVSVSKESGQAITFKSNTSFHNSGTIKLLPNGFEYYYILCIPSSAENVHIIGGFVVGDAMEHDYTSSEIKGTHEWGKGITIMGNKCSVSFTDVTYCTGDSYNISKAKDCMLANFSASYSRRQGVTVGKQIENLEIKNFHIAHIGNLPTDDELKKGTNPRAAIDIEPNRTDTEGAFNITIDNGIIEDCRHAVEWLRSDNYSQNINLTVSNIIVKNPYGTSFPLRGEHITLRNIKQIDDNPDEALDFIDLRSATSSQKIILENIETFGEIEDNDLPPSTDLIPGKSCIITNSSFSRIVTNGNWEINNCSLSKVSCESGITRINNSTISNPGYAIIGNTIHTEYVRGLILNNCSVTSIEGNCVFQRFHTNGFAEFHNCKFYLSPGNSVLRGPGAAYTIVDNCDVYSLDGHKIPFIASNPAPLTVEYTQPQYLHGDTLPEITSQYSAGHRFFHTTLGNIYWNGSYWVDAVGTRVSYSVAYNLTNVYTSKYKAPVKDESYSFTLSAPEGYKIPDSITITMGGATLTAGTDYTYNTSTGKVKVLGAGGSGGVTDDLVITAAGVGVVTYNVEYSLTAITTSNYGPAVAGEPFTTILTPDEGYALPDILSAESTMGGIILVRGLDYTLNPTTGELVIGYVSGASDDGVTGDIKIVAEAVEE